MCILSEIVKYHNDLNTAIMRQWTKDEMNFFFAILSKAKNKGTERIVFNADELKELVKYNVRHLHKFLYLLEQLSKKLTQLYFHERTETSSDIMVLFQRFHIDINEMTVEVQTSEHFSYIINKLEANFTKFELEEFTNIRSTYAKTMYRLIKQWRTIGKKEFRKEDLFALLDVPLSVQRPSNFNRQVLKPILDELSVYFIDLKVKPIKTKKRGTPIVAYEFTWKKEETEEWIEGKYGSSIGSTPDWYDPNYKNKTAPEQISELEKIRQESLDKMKN